MNLFSLMKKILITYERVRNARWFSPIKTEIRIKKNSLIIQTSLIKYIGQPEKEEFSWKQAKIVHLL